MAKTPGITARHARTCPAKTARARETGARCNCEPSYEAFVYSKRDGKKIRKSFSGKGALTAAKNWRADNTRAVRLKQLRAPTAKTVRQAVDEFLAGAEAGEIRNKRKQAYKPSVVRQYRSTLEKWFLPEFGDRRLSDVDTADLLALKEWLFGQRIADSTVRNVFVPVQAVFRRARKMGEIALNPAEDLELPTGDNARERAATPGGATAFIEALPIEDRALWATAFYGGLRRGELRALRVDDINHNCIHVEYGWDDKQGQIAPKSKASRRDVPLTEALRAHLDRHLDRTGRSGEDLVFGRTASLPFTPHHVSDRADGALAAAAVGVFVRMNHGSHERYTLHEARHTFATWLDASGVSALRGDVYMGHSDGSMRRRYTHPDLIAEDAKRLDDYISGAKAGKVVALDVAS